MKNISKPIIISIIIGVALILMAIIGTVIMLNSNSEVLEIYDESLGYKTTFKYSAKKGYKIEEPTESTNTFQEVIFVNEKKNKKIEMFYYDTSSSIYERSKKLRESNDNYKENNFHPEKDHYEKVIETIFDKVTDGILNGDISIDPRNDACKFCDYKNICHSFVKETPASDPLYVDSEEEDDEQVA